MTRNLAYLDPGSASMMLQMVGGALAAAAVTLKLYWRRILRAVGLGKEPSDADEA